MVSPKTSFDRRGHLGRTKGPPVTLIYRMLFAGAYLSLIMSTTSLVQQNESLSFLFFVVRSGALIVILALWLASSAFTGRANRISAAFALLFWPYLFTEAYLAYLDVLILLILWSDFQKLLTREEYFVRLAFLSLGLVLSIALLAWLSIIPTTTFAWDSRVKEGMGFVNPNTFYFFLVSSAAVFFLFKRHVGFVLTGIAVISLFPLVGSRSFLGTYLLLTMIWLWPSFLHYRLAIALLWAWLAAVIALGLLLVWFPDQISLALNATFGMDVNELTSNRLELAGRAQSTDIVQHLFGGRANTADSLFIYFANSFGLFGVVAFLYVTLTSVRRQIRHGKPSALAFTAIYFTAGLVEVPFDGSALIALLFFSVVLFGKANRPENMVRDRNTEQFATT